MDETLVIYGGAIKSLGGGRFAGPLVTYTDASRPDLAADFFDAETSFGMDLPAALPLYYNHGQDAVIGKKRIGTGTVTKTDAGLWYEGQIDARNAYTQAIQRLVESGVLGLSSGACSHLVEREPVGKAYHLKQWVMAEASLTPEPCEFSHTVSPLKSLPAVKSFKAILQEMADAEADAGEQAETPDAEQPAESPAQDAPEAEVPDATKSTDAADPETADGSQDALLDALEALPLKTFLEAMGAVASLTDRRLAWYAERRETKQGRAISAENLAKMRDIHDGMKQHLSHLKDILDRHTPDPMNKPKAVTAQSAYMDYLYAASHGGSFSL